MNPLALLHAAWRCLAALRCRTPLDELALLSALVACA